MIRKLAFFAAGLAAGYTAVSILLPRPRGSVPVDLKPGRWFSSYIADWMEAHGVTNEDDVKSGFALGAVSGEWIWVTETPEWDRAWLEGRGSKFPDKWVPYAFLEAGIPSASGEVIGLPGL